MFFFEHGKNGELRNIILNLTICYWADVFVLDFRFCYWLQMTMQSIVHPCGLFLNLLCDTLIYSGGILAPTPNK